MIYRSRIDWHLILLFKLNHVLQVHFITKRVNNTRNGDQKITTLKGTQSSGAHAH